MKETGFIGKAFNFINYIKDEWETRVVGKYHEDESVSAILRAGKKYYKDPALAYEEHVWVYSSVWAVANAAAMLMPKMFDIDKDGNQIELDTHWLLDLLDYPNGEYSGYDLIEGTFSFLELMGDAFWEVIRNSLGRPAAFYLMRTDKVQVIGDEKKLTKGYIYTPNTKAYNLLPEDVIHFRYFSPRSEINGQGSIRAATSSLEADYLGNEYFKDFFRRGAEPSFALEMPHRMSDPSYSRLQGALKTKHQGTGKQRGILIVEEGGKYVQTQIPPKDSGESETSAKARRSVAASVGVPPIKLQLLEGAAYANARFQDVGFWRNTMEPRLKKFYSKITLDCLRKVGSTAWLIPDMAKVLMNIDEFVNETTAYCNLVDRGIISRNDIRQKLDFGVVPGGDVLTVQPNLAPLKELVGEEKEENEPEPEG